jgi:hypothetical protein
MSVPVFECVTLVASNDTGNGGVAVVNCYSEPVDLDGAESMCVQVTIDTIWGAGTASPKLVVVVQYSSDGVNFGDDVSITELANLTAAGTKVGSPTSTPSGGMARVHASFELDTAGTTGPGAVTFGAWVSSPAAAL